MDESMPMPESGESELLSLETEIPVKLDSLEADGVRPAVGDQVSLKIEGTVKSIKDDCVYVTPVQVNGDELSQLLADHAPESEDAGMERMTREADLSGTPLGGEGY